jgi:hypothetical protein
MVGSKKYDSFCWEKSVKSQPYQIAVDDNIPGHQHCLYAGTKDDNTDRMVYANQIKWRKEGIMRWIYLSIAIILAGALSACAGIDVKPIRTQADDKCARGFRYYQPAPFLLVYSDGKGGLISQIKFLPDTTEKMSVRPYAYFASNDGTLEFDAGMLKQASVAVDETIVPVAALDALAKALGAAAAAALNAPQATNEATVPVPYLFKIVVKGDKIELNGGPKQGAALGPDGETQILIHATIPK